MKNYAEMTLASSNTYNVPSGLDKAYDEHDFILLLLKVEPMFDKLRTDPRFTVLLKRVGLEP